MKILKHSFEIDSVASSGDQEMCMKFVSFPWTMLVATLSIFNAIFFVETVFCEENNKNKGDCHQCRIISFKKNVCLEMIRLVGQ